MKALIFKLGLNSLYSIRIPFTWQSALTYPILPPSAVIGLIANALQRYKNDKHPIEYLKIIEGKVIWAGSRLLTPCVIKSYITSAIVKWEDILGGKFTNALGREYAYTRELECLIIFSDESLIKDLEVALISSPLTCGDSESPAYVDGEPKTLNVSEPQVDKVETSFPVPFNPTIQITEGRGKIYLMHERCHKKDESFPLKSFIVPIEEKGRILYPTTIKVPVENLIVLNTENGLSVLIDVVHEESLVKKTKHKKKRKKR
ncbi:CRISPR-associated protein Cas5 [Thermodesulfovibrio sp. TK110]